MQEFVLVVFVAVQRIRTTARHLKAFKAGWLRAFFELIGRLCCNLVEA